MVTEFNLAYNRITPYITKTPLEYNKRLSDKYNSNIYIKREDLQVCRSFKIRGALNKILGLDNAQKQAGIVCASAGNHAQGVAFSANELNINTDIFLPNTTPLQKINRIKYLMGKDTKLHITGNTLNDCLKEALNYTELKNKTFIHPYNDTDVIIGQGTIGIELFNNPKLIPDTIIGAIGGGGLMAGISSYGNEMVNSKIIDNNPVYIGVEPTACPSMKESISKGYPVELEPVDSFVDGATVSKVGDKTFDICKDTLANVYTVENGKVCETMIDLYQEDGIIAEPAGALSVSVLDDIYNNQPELIENKNVVCILSGGNNDITRYPDIVDKYLQYQGLKVYYIIQFIQRPGELKNFVNNILSDQCDVVRFEYIKKTNKGFGNVLLGIELERKEDSQYIESKMDQIAMTYTKINGNDQLFSYLVLSRI